MATERIRGRKRKQRRANLLEREPLCRTCLQQGRVRPATIADHVVALVNGGSDTEDNLAPICAPCHEIKTRNDLGYKPEIGLDGWPIDV